jgi:deoxyribodipyrimidine photo-lyase
MPDFNRSLIWFRRDLRLTDQAALFHALKLSKAIHCAFVFDTEILAGLPKADRRVEFIWQSIAALKQDLKRLGVALKTGQVILTAGFAITQPWIRNECLRLA